MLFFRKTILNYNKFFIAVFVFGLDDKTLECAEIVIVIVYPVSASVLQSICSF